MTHPAEPYLPRRLTPLPLWQGAGHQIKGYAIHRNAEDPGPALSDTMFTAIQVTLAQVLDTQADPLRSHGLGFYIAHVGEEAVWLLIDWWNTGGILSQCLFRAPLERPAAFERVTEPALACVWELILLTHERNAWVRHMLTPAPRPDAYLADSHPAGRY